MTWRLMAHLDDMEGIGHLDGPGHHGVEDAPVGTREVEGGPLDPRAELEALVIEPLLRALGASTGDDVEELAGSTSAIEVANS